jgi:hypothetical protein
MQLVSDETLGQLGKNLEGHPVLNELKLEFSEGRKPDKIKTNQGIAHLFKSFISIPQLFQLNLSVKSCTQITNGGLEDISQLFNELAVDTVISNLRLNFSGCKVTEEYKTKMKSKINDAKTKALRNIVFSIAM